MSTEPVNTVRTAAVSAAAGGCVTASAAKTAVVTTSAVTITAAALRRRAAPKNPPLEWQKTGKQEHAPHPPNGRRRVRKYLPPPLHTHEVGVWVISFSLLRFPDLLARPPARPIKGE